MWLDYNQQENSKYSASFIAATIWYLWKAKCDYILRQKNPNYPQIAYNAMNHTKEFLFHTNNHKLLVFYLQNKPNPSSMGIFSSVA